MKVGIIGAGTMGSGIAQAFAQTEGYEVMLCDVKAEWAAAGKAKIAKGFEKRVAKGKMAQEKADAIPPMLFSIRLPLAPMRSLPIVIWLWKLLWRRWN